MMAPAPSNSVLRVVGRALIPFILLFALFTIAGGILVAGNIHGTPLVNTALLVIGAFTPRAMAAPRIASSRASISKRGSSARSSRRTSPRASAATSGEGTPRGGTPSASCGRANRGPGGCPTGAARK